MIAVVEVVHEISETTISISLLVTIVPLIVAALVQYWSSLCSTGLGVYCHG